MYFVVHPQNQSVLRFEILELQCSVTSLTIFNFTFSWNFTKKGSSLPMQIVSLSDYSLKETSNSTRLIIESAHWKHAGVYTCIVAGGNDIIQTESSVDVLSKLIKLSPCMCTIS